MRVRGWLWIWVLFGACEKRAAPSQTTSSQAASSGATPSCRDRAVELSQFLATADEAPNQAIHIARKHELVERPDLPIRELALAAHVSIDASGNIDVDGSKVPAASLEQAIRTADRGSDPRVIYFAIGAGTTWGVIVSAAQAAQRAGRPKLNLVFAVPAKSKPPPTTPAASEIARELAKAAIDKDGAATATVLASHISRSVADCPTMSKLFQSLGELEPRDKMKQLVDGSVAALVDCECAVDFDRLRASYWHLLGDKTPAAVVAVELADDGASIELPAATLWSAAHGRFADGTKVQLHVRP